MESIYMTENLKKKIEEILKKDIQDVDVIQEISRLLDPWEEARGVLKHKNLDPVSQQIRLRKELERDSR